MYRSSLRKLNGDTFFILVSATQDMPQFIQSRTAVRVVFKLLRQRQRHRQRQRCLENQTPSTAVTYDSPEGFIQRQFIGKFDEEIGQKDSPI